MIFSILVAWTSITVTGIQEVTVTTVVVVVALMVVVTVLEAFKTCFFVATFPLIMNKPSKSLMNLLLLTLLTLCMNLSWAKGMKGNLEANEIAFMENTFIPILLKANLCTKATGDCKDDHIICWSGDSLSCDIYGISDSVVIKEILLAMLNSGLSVSSFNFWKSKYHNKSAFEKPLLSYQDRTVGK